MDLLQQPKRADKGLVPDRSPWKKRANAWRKRTPFNPYWIELRWLRRVTEGLAPHAHGKLLDVGVGEKPYGELFEPHVTQYVGLEYPPVADNLHPEIWGMLERIRGVVDVFGDGQRMPFSSASFDTALALEVLEHVRDPEACLTEIARVLRPGGTLLLTVPFVAPLHQWPFDYLRFTPRGVEALLERHGFKVESLAARGNFASATGAMLAPWLLIAVVQLFFALCEKMSTDDGSCLGYAVVAKLNRASS
jgi:SAM-dependent methyltransferase